MFVVRKHRLTDDHFVANILLGAVNSKLVEKITCLSSFGDSIHAKAYNSAFLWVLWVIKLVEQATDASRSVREINFKSSNLLF